MTRTDPCPDCPNVERRQGERRQVVKQTFAYCARLVSIITVATASISIGAAVSISQAITSTIHREHITDMQALRDWSQDMETRILKLEAR